MPSRLPVPGQDAGSWGTILNDYLIVSHNDDGTIKPAAIANKAEDSAVVHKTGTEVIGGDKSFSGTITVPTPTDVSHATTKAYVDATTSSGTPDATASNKGKVKLAGDLNGTADVPTLNNTANVSSIINTVIAGNSTVSGALQKSANLSDLASVSTAKSNLSLENVNNTSDANKPISTATQTALNAKADGSSVLHLAGTETVTGDKTFSGVVNVASPTNATNAATKGYVDTATGGALLKSANLSDLASIPTAKTNLGIDNVTNTSDANKPVSTATQTALNTKADDNNTVHLDGTQTITGDKTFSGVVIVPTPTDVGHATTKAYVDSTVSTGTPDATTATKGKIKLAGDLSGTADLPTLNSTTNVTNIINTVVDANTTVAGSAQKSANLSDLANITTAKTNLGLAAVASSGQYSDLSGKPTIPTAGTGSGNYAAGNDSRFAGSAAGTVGASLSATDASVTNGRAPTGSASGDLSGTYPAPIVVKINGTTVPATPNVSQRLIATGTASGSTTTSKWLNGPTYMVDAFGADPTGTASSDAAVAAAMAALGSNPGVIEFGVGTYLLSNSVGTFGPKQSVIGAGRGATTLKFSGTGDCIRAVDPFTYVAGTHPGSGGMFRDFGIDGTGAGAGSTGIHYGDLSAGRMQNVAISNFTGTGSIGLYLHNMYTWAERSYIEATVSGCTQQIVFDGSNGASTTSSFLYSTFNFRFNASANQDGIVLQNRAVVSGGQFSATFNVTPGVTNTGTVLIVGRAADSSSNASHIDHAAVHFVGENSTAGSTGHKTMYIGDSSSIRAIGVMSFTNGAFSNGSKGTGATFGFAGYTDIDTVFGKQADSISLSYTGTLLKNKGFVGSSNGPQIYLENGNIFQKQLSNTPSAQTVSFGPFSSTLAGKPLTFDLFLQQPATGGPITLTWPSGFTWLSGSAPTLSTTANATDHIRVVTPDNTTFYGMHMNASATPTNLPAITAWAASTNYTINQLVTYNSGLYQALSTFTSGATFSASNWTKLTPTSISQTYTTNSTWTMPAGAVSVNVMMVGPGGGGGSGARLASGTASSGGGGGGSGAFTNVTLMAADLTATVAVTVGTGGAGGAAVATDNTNGAVGSPGSSGTSFGNFAIAGRGFGGSAGGTVTATGGGGSSLGTTVSSTAGVGTIAAAGTTPNNSPSGGGGGGISATPAAFAGGTGGTTFMNASNGGTSGATGANGGAGAPSATHGYGTGGGGGGASIVSSGAGSGGVGGGYGTGGGGGGASLNGLSSGAGGAGASGICIVTTYF